MGAVGDIYRVDMKTNLLGQECHNIFWYQATGGLPSSVDLNAGLIDTGGVFFSIQDVVSAEVQFLEFDTQDVNSSTDFDTESLVGNTGHRSGDCLPPFVAYTFKYVRASRAVRNGSKRIPGVAESDQVNGVPTSAELTLLTTLAGVLSAPISPMGGGIYVPVIVRVTYPVPNPSHLPPLSWTAFDINDVIYEHIGSQNSRKF